MDKIIERVKEVLLNPYDALVQVKTEEISVNEALKKYIYILAAIPSVAMFIGLIGRVNDRGESISFGANILFSLLLFAILVAGVFLAAKVINFLAPHLSSISSDENAFKLSLYSFIPAFTAGIFNINPSLSFLWFLGSLYGGYVFYLGAPVLMETDENKRIAFTVVSCLAIYIVMITLFKIILSWTIGASLPSFR